MILLYLIAVASGFATLLVAIRGFPEGGIWIGCVAVAMGLAGLAWSAQITWLPTLSERLQDHGRRASAEVLSVRHGQADSDMVTSARIRFDPGTGPVVTSLGTRDSFRMQIEDLKRGSSADIVYDPDHPADAMPADVVGKIGHDPRPARMWWLCGSYTLLMATLTGIQIVRYRRGVPQTSRAPRKEDLVPPIRNSGGSDHR
ncbi:DUF3592 domain-containing protein [Actinoallomurus sp. NPDC050550]|uniref:DUF3592 domain-containing protein n=1 Tax=Actinoallomurus sp. NPDC050550 TaxID=3154937 RepID=UPI0033F818FC